MRDFFKLTVLFASFLGSNSCMSESLVLSVTTGKAPLHVQVTGPDRLIGLGKGKWGKWVGCSFNIDWNDSKNEKPFDQNGPCSQLLEHTYEKPGTYKIQVNTFHPNPDDSHTTDWKSEQTVIVK